MECCLLGTKGLRDERRRACCRGPVQEERGKAAMIYEKQTDKKIEVPTKHLKWFLLFLNFKDRNKQTKKQIELNALVFMTFLYQIN